MRPFWLLSCARLPLGLVLVACLGLLVRPTAAALEARFGDQGLESILVDGQERLVSGQPAVTQIRDQMGKPLKSTPVSSTFDAATRTVKQEYSWGRVSFRYEVDPHGLRVHVDAENTGKEWIDSVVFHLMALEPLGEKSWVAQPTHGMERPTLVTGSGARGAAVLFNADPGKPLQLQLAEEKGKGKETQVLNVRVAMGGQKVILDNVTAERPLIPEGTESFVAGLRLGPAGAEPLELAKDLLDRYREQNPMLLKWEDRRPMLRMFFGGGLSIPEAIENMKNPDAVQPPAPDPKFRTQFLDKMKMAVEAAKFCNAQLVILWDLEGGTFPHATTYIGDPRLIRLLNPQMDLVADEGIKLLKDAGLKIGLTLRPSRVIYDNAKNNVRHSHASDVDPYEELSAKVEYAKKRWGCEVFYVDTNVFWRPYGPEQKWQSAQLTSSVWKRLLEAYPDTLFIPEFGNPSDFPYTVPYTEADMGGYGAAPLVKALWPEAFQAVVIEDADPYENFERFVGAVRQGNALMTQASGARTRNIVAAVRIYQEAALLKAGVPDEVVKAAPVALAGLLKSPDLRVRLHAARRLRDEPQPTAAAALWSAAQSESEDWLVRHAAVRALAGVPHAPAVPFLIGLLTNDTLQLQEAAVFALGGQSQKDAAAVMALVETEALNPSGNARRLEILGKALRAMKAADQAPALEALVARVPDGKNAQAIRRGLVFAVAGLKNPASEPFFNSTFEDEKLKDAAATGLVLLGSDAGIAKVRAATAAASKAKNDILAKRLNDALKAK